MEEEKKEIMHDEPMKKETVHQEKEKKEEPKQEKKGFCIASLVLGIVALVFFCLWYISIPCGILAIIFGILGIKTVNKGMAIAGLITGCIGLIVSIFIFVALFIFGFAMGLSDALNTICDEDYYDYSDMGYEDNDYYDYEDYDYDLYE